MKTEINKKIEEYVLKELNVISSSDPNDVKDRIHNVKAFIDILQKEDINIQNSINNSEKNKIEDRKLDLDEMKITQSGKLEADKLEVDKTKVNNSFKIEEQRLSMDKYKVDENARVEETKIQLDKDKHSDILSIENRKLDMDKYKVDENKKLETDKIDIERIKQHNNLAIENRKIDVNEIKNNNDESFRYKELLMKKENDINEQTDRIINIGLNAVSIIGPIVLYNIWMKRGFEFEKEGTFTSGTFRNLINKFRP